MDVRAKAEQLHAGIQGAVRSVDLNKLSARRNELREESSRSDLWDNPENAKNTMRLLADLDKDIEQWTALEKEAAELLELSKLDDESLAADLAKRVAVLEKRFNNQQTQAAFDGPYDDHDAVINIFSGAGGTDAQDFSAMLLRMYTRYCESSDIKARIIDESAGEEAGIKSATVLVSGRHAYGKLKSEHGVHRLVRLSPFNAKSLRQTSFAKVDVLPKIDRPESLPIDDKDLKIDVFRAGGHGGQSVNTTDSAVRITHLPTSIVVSIQNERSQLQNKETALTILRSKLAAMQLEQHKENIAELKGPNQSAEWGNQIRSYVLHPYTMVKDLRTKHETSDAQGVLDGDLEPFIKAALTQNIQSQ